MFEESFNPEGENEGSGEWQDASMPRYEVREVLAKGIPVTLLLDIVSGDTWSLDMSIGWVPIPAVTGKKGP